MNDLSQETIKNLFYSQIRKMTQETINQESFDYQFSDRWIFP